MDSHKQTMLKKILMVAVATTFVVAHAAAQSGVVLKNIDNQSYRVGVSFPMINCPVNHRFGIDALVLTDGEPFGDLVSKTVNGPPISNLYLGGGAHYRLFKTKHADIAAVVGYTTDLVSLHHPKHGAWGLGIEARINF